MQKKKTCGNFLFLCSVLTLCFVSPVYANEVATKIESLSDFLLQIVQAAGVIVILFGIFSFGAGWLAHDSSQQFQGVRVIIGGLIMLFASALLSLLNRDEQNTLIQK